ADGQFGVPDKPEIVDGGPARNQDRNLINPLWTTVQRCSKTSNAPRCIVVTLDLRRGTMYETITTQRSTASPNHSTAASASTTSNSRTASKRRTCGQTDPLAKNAMLGGQGYPNTLPFP
ncbi:hypothetical protein BaRGS_00003057, partial [Batillaria attramentaria]